MCTVAVLLVYAATVSLTLPPARGDMEAFCDRVASDALLLLIQNDPTLATTSCDAPGAEYFFYCESRGHGRPCSEISGCDAPALGHPTEISPTCSARTASTPTCCIEVMSKACPICSHVTSFCSQHCFGELEPEQSPLDTETSAPTSSPQSTSPPRTTAPPLPSPEPTPDSDPAPVSGSGSSVLSSRDDDEEPAGEGDTDDLDEGRSPSLGTTGPSSFIEGSASGSEPEASPPSRPPASPGSGSLSQASASGACRLKSLLGAWVSGTMAVVAVGLCAGL